MLLILYLCVFTFLVPCCDVCCDFRIKTMFGTSLPRMFVRGIMSYICYLCLFLYSGVQHFVMLYVSTFLVPCCDVHYDFRIKNDVCLRLYPQLFVGGPMSYLCYFCLFTYSGVKHVFTILVPLRVPYKRQELFNLPDQLGFTSDFW